MIRRTIKEHLDKEKRLRPQGIKVLSLFFIDAVEQYRQYDDDGNAGEGQVRAHLRGGISPRWRSIPTIRRLFEEVDLDVATPRKSTTATSRSTRRAAGPTRPRTTRPTATTPSAPTT